MFLVRDGPVSTFWYAVRTRPQKEFAVRNRLLKLGYAVYLPVLRQTKRSLHRKESPFFPGYLFLHCDLAHQQLGPLEHVSEFLGFVHFEGQRPPIPDEVIADLRQRISSIEQRGGMWHKFQAGESVVVKLGRFENPGEILVTEQSPKERVWVLVHFLGSLVRAQVPWQDVVPTSAHAPSPIQPLQTPRRTRGKGRWIRGMEPRAFRPIPSSAG